jgi:dTDP-4-amino-4,6-dideoxygalactose transaminase
MIPVMKPILPSYEIAREYLKRIELSRIYSNRGPLVRELETKYADLFGIESSRVVAMANATLALQACVQLSERKKWAVPNYTFAASGLAVLQAQKKLVLIEVRSEDWKIDLSLVDRTIYGLVPVIPFGAPINFANYSSFDDVVIDAAASLGAPIHGIEEMKSGHFIVFSLHATKVLGAGEGSIVVCGSIDAANELRSWLNFGFDEFRESNILGTNAKMSEFSAAFALSSYDNLETEKRDWLKLIEKKKLLLNYFDLDNFSDHLPGFRPYWIFDAQETDSDLLILKLKNRNIESRRWWPKPLSKMKIFGEIEVIGGDRVACSLSKGLLGLPFWRDMSIETLEEIVSVLHRELK